MKHIPLFGAARYRCLGGPDSRCRNLPDRRRPFLIPVRFVAACEDGHIQDFPFLEWVHGGPMSGNDHHLTFRAGRRSASLAGIWIRCSCGKRRSMQGAFGGLGGLESVGVRCGAGRPWLGEDPSGSCQRSLRVLQRGASNVHFPVTFSSIYLPLAGDVDEPIRAILDDPILWNQLSDGLEDGRIMPVRAQLIASWRRVDPQHLLEAAQRKVDGAGVAATAMSEVEYRRQEYLAIKSGLGGRGTELVVDWRDAGEYAIEAQSVLAGVGLIRKLRETRVLAGFTRLLPGSPDQPVTANRIQPISRPGIAWLPAITVNGEGIFLEFRTDALEHWVAKEPVKKRAAQLARAYNRTRVDRGLQETEVTARLIVLHTFAHLLIRQLSFDCGYGGAALRERIYESEAGPDGSMQGILIYTASGDSEGTMGGLVRQGEAGRLENTIAEAIRNSAWCSSDPVCIESDGQGTDSANLAACHCCALVSETSCEFGNRLLDRGLVVGTLGEPSIAFRPSWPSRDE